MDLSGQKLGEYELERRLGRGGMAEVYQAFQSGIERVVAVKVLHRHMVDDDGLVERFKREAKGIGKLDHPNIVRVIEYNIAEHYIVLDYVSGGTLRSYLETKGVLPPVEALEIMAQLTDAVAYAHREGVIHRDIKPDNIMFKDEAARHVVLTDFGLARLHDGANLTIQGSVIGTAGYVSPEVLDGNPADERSDVYSLGIVFYQMLTGSTPYHASTPYGMMRKQINDPLPAPREKNPDLSPEIEALVLKALEEDPNSRIQSAYDFHVAVKEMLMALQSGSGRRPINNGHSGPHSILRVPPLPPVPPKSPVQTEPPKPSINWRPILAVGGGVLLAALVTVFVVLFFSRMDERNPAEDNQNTAMVESTSSNQNQESENTSGSAMSNVDQPTDESREGEGGYNENEVTNEDQDQTTTPDQAVMSDETSVGVFRFVDNDNVQAGDIALEINQLPPLPEGSHYELLLIGENADKVLNLGELPVENDQVTYTDTTNENLLATYHQVTVNLVSDDGSGEELMVLMGTLDPDYIKQLRALIVADQTKGFLPNVVEQSQLANQQATKLQNALRANDLAEAKRYAEQVIHILEGDSGEHYGDLNGDGQVENPGNGFGVQKYLTGIQGQTRRVMENANRTEAQKASANQLIALSEGALSASDQSIDFALQLLEATTIDENTKTVATKLEWYVIEILEGPPDGPGGMIAAYEYGLRMAEVNLFPS